MHKKTYFIWVCIYIQKILDFFNVKILSLSSLFSESTLSSLYYIILLCSYIILMSYMLQ